MDFVAHYEKLRCSQQIYSGKILGLRRDMVELENGHVTVREVVEHPGGAAILALDEKGQALFVRQFRYPFGQVLLELPAGKLERGEDPEICARRELEEECGYRAEEFALLAKLFPTCAYDEEIIHIFLARGLVPTAQRLDEDEFLTVERIPVEKAVKMALAGEFPDAKTQLGILKYALLYSQGK